MFPWNLGSSFHKNKDHHSQNPVNPHDVQQFIQQLFSQMPGDIQQMMKQNQSSFSQQEKKTETNGHNHLHADIFETHSAVYVRIPIKDPSLMNSMKIFYSQREVIIEGMPTSKDRHELALPCSVLKKGSTAHFKEDILEIKLRKNPNPTLLEIDISRQ